MADYRAAALDFINKHGGVENFRCFVRMPLPRYVPYWLVRTWAECKLDELFIQDRCEWDLIFLRPLDRQDSWSRCYSWPGFMRLVNEGLLIPKMRDDQHIHHIVMAEHLCGAAYIIHERDIIV